jgi:hypothetical protein
MAPRPQRLTITRRGWALARPFTTAHGVKTTAAGQTSVLDPAEARAAR